MTKLNAGFVLFVDDVKSFLLENNTGFLLKDDNEKILEFKNLLKKQFKTQKINGKEVFSDEVKESILNIDPMYFVENVLGLKIDEKNPHLFLSVNMFVMKLKTILQEIISEDNYDITYWSSNSDTSFDSYVNLFKNAGFELIQEEDISYTEKNVILSDTKESSIAYAEKKGLILSNEKVNSDGRVVYDVTYREKTFMMLNDDNLLIIGDTYYGNINHLNLYGEGYLKSHERKLSCSSGFDGLVFRFNIDMRDLPINSLESIYKNINLISPWASVEATNSFIYTRSYLDEKIGRNENHDFRLTTLPDDIQRRLGVVSNLSENTLSFFNELSDDEVNELYVRYNLIVPNYFIDTPNINNIIFGDEILNKIHKSNADISEVIKNLNFVYGKSTVRGEKHDVITTSIIENKFSENDLMVLNQKSLKDKYLFFGYDESLVEKINKLLKPFNKSENKTKIRLN